MRHTHLHINRFASKAIQFDDYIFHSLRYHVTILLLLAVLHVTQVLSQKIVAKDGDRAFTLIEKEKRGNQERKCV